MSYILDALKKSAEERRILQEQKTQSYDPLFIAQKSRGRKDRSRLEMLIMFLLIGGLLTGLWFYNSQLKTQLSAPQFSVQSHGQKPAEENTVPGKPDAPATETAPPQAVTSAPESHEALKLTETVVQPAGQQAAPAEKSTGTPAISSADVPLLKELPFAAQAAIPEMKFSGHVFSADPRLRLVMVNTSIVREGEMITPEIKLIEITDNGLVFSYHQTRFKVVLF